MNNIEQTTLRAAVIQAGAVPFSPGASVTKAIKLMSDAAHDGCQLAVFPEAFISAYPKGLDFGGFFGGRTPEGREMFRQYYESAIDVPGKYVDRLCAGARAAGLYVVIGVIERDGGTLYCTTLFLGPDGTYLGKHRKLMPTGVERIVWGTGDGSTLTTVDTPFGRMGSVICWENYMPLMRMAMFAKGVQIYCAPTADDKDGWVPTMQHIAMEGRCFVLSACQYIKRAAFPDDYPIDDQRNAPETVLLRGGSLIVDPLGNILTGPDFDGETILTAELDLGALARGKYDFDVSGHYARPDIFKLHVNESTRPAVIFDREQISEEQ